jgi:hypothetical protein
MELDGYGRKHDQHAGDVETRSTGAGAGRAVGSQEPVGAAGLYRRKKSKQYKAMRKESREFLRRS